MILQPGVTVVNRYRIARLLGQGGFGAVYQAWDINLRHLCALKVNLETTAEAQRQFEREARILANLSHPNLPRVTDHFTIPGQGQFLIMDFVEGEDLQQVLDRTRAPLPEAQVLTWISQICDALHYLHSQNPPIIHRDVKPANIKITPQGQAMLVDFGIAKIYDPQMRTTIGARAVTPGYSPPEQYGRASTDPRSDVYALGATLYTLLTGQEPLESIQRSLGKPMTPPKALNPSLSSPVEQAILKAMEVIPERRFQRMDELKVTLVQALSGGIPATARATPPIAPTTVGGTARTMPPTGTQDGAPYSPSPAMPAPPSISVAPPVTRGAFPWKLIVVGAVTLLGLMLLLVFGMGALLSGGGIDRSGTESAISATQTSLAFSPPLLPTKPLPTTPGYIVSSPFPTAPPKVQPSPQYVPPTQPPAPPPQRPSSARVLWDVSHGPRSGSSGTYDPSGVFSNLVGLLSGQGVYVEGGDLGGVADFQALVISSTSAAGRSYDAGEADRILEFVRNGGGLLILCEDPGFSNHVQEVASRFGVQAAQQPTLDNITQLSNHPIFSGVSMLDFYQGGSLQVSGNAEAIAVEGGAVAVAVNISMSGRVVIIGDSNLLDNRWLNNNQQFAINVFRWITFLMD